MARAAEHHLDLRAGPERAVAATKTYTATLVALAMITAELAAEGRPGGTAELGARVHPDAPADLARLPDALAAVLDLEGEARRIAADQAALDRCVVLGRGYHYATAREWSLKLKELAYVLADPYSSADFIHGPLALIEAGFPTFAVAPRGATTGDMEAVIERLAEGLGAHLLIVSDDASLCARGEWSLRLPAGLPEWLMPIISIVPCQLHAMHLTMAKGRDPEQPRSIAKVTRTS
jgi:glucosamine--fructose-6-phosphate aminotransferase (isomerizing)